MYCKNCGKQISSIADECPYCKTKVNENNNQQKNNNSNNVLYYGMNGKPVTTWKFIVGIILLIGGIFLAISAVL